MKNTELIFLLIIGLYSCSNPTIVAEKKVLDCLHAENSLALKLIPKFESHLIQNGYIDKWDKANILSLISDIKTKQTTIDLEEIVPYYGDEIEIFGPSKFAMWTYCFTEIAKEMELNQENSLSAVSFHVTKMVSENNLGLPNDIAIINAIQDGDFEKDLYKIPILYLLWTHIRRQNE